MTKLQIKLAQYKATLEQATKQYFGLQGAVQALEEAVAEEVAVIGAQGAQPVEGGKDE